MNAVVIIVLVILAIAVFGGYVLYRALKRKFNQHWRTQNKIDEVLLLHKGLEQVGFFGPSDEPGKLKVIENGYLSKMATNLTRDGVLWEYASKEKLTISNNTNPGVRYGWLLRSDDHCLGIDVRQ